MKNATITMLFLIVITLIYQGIRISQLDKQVNKDLTNQIEYLETRLDALETLTMPVDTSMVDTTMIETITIDTAEYNANNY